MLPEDYWSTIQPGNTGLLHQRQTINGYSPFRLRGLSTVFSLSYMGGAFEDGPLNATMADPETGLPYLDLMAVDRVVAMRGLYADTFAGNAGSGWKMTKRTETADVFERTRPQKRIGNIVRWPAGARIGNPVLKTRSESYDVETGPSGGQVVVARAWYPGVRASLDGVAVPVETVGRIIPSVVLPPNTKGRLVVEYWPAGLTAGLWTALLGIIVLPGATVAMRKGLLHLPPLPR